MLQKAHYLVFLIFPIKVLELQQSENWIALIVVFQLQPKKGNTAVCCRPVESPLHCTALEIIASKQTTKPWILLPTSRSRRLGLPQQEETVTFQSQSTLDKPFPYVASFARCLAPTSTIQPFFKPECLAVLLANDPPLHPNLACGIPKRSARVAPKVARYQVSMKQPARKCLPKLPMKMTLRFAPWKVRTPKTGERKWMWECDFDSL